MKLLNSYGFGLCYHIAPLLEAVWKAGGFEDARVWFLTGHTVAEVFYDGAYHYFDKEGQPREVLAEVENDTKPGGVGATVAYQAEAAADAYRQVEAFLARHLTRRPQQ